MKYLRHISGGEIREEDVLSAVRNQDLFPADFASRRELFQMEAVAIDETLENLKIPKGILRREQLQRMNAYAHQLAAWADAARAKMCQINDEEENFARIMKAFRELPKGEQRLLMEMIYYGKKPEAIEVSGGKASERTIWRRRKAIIEKLLDTCNARRKKS